MAKKKKKSEAIQLQELANKSAKEIQSMINSANKLTQDFNAKEAEKARKFNSQEAATARKFNAEQSALERDFNSAEAEKARAWQTEMSNTAHQREVADLRKAGLNPVLSANSGAQSYTTSSANAGAASSSAASAGAASGSFESGAGAMSAILGGLMSSMTGLKQSEIAASAQLQSSKVSAEASRYAADVARQNALTSAEAQKYAADRNYQAQMDKPQSSLVALIDKYFAKFFGTDDSSIKENANSLASKTKKALKGFSRTALEALSRGKFSVGGRDSSLDRSRVLLSNYGIDLNSITGSDRSRAARAIYELNYTKTRDHALSTLANLRRKYPL